MARGALTDRIRDAIDRLCAADLDAPPSLDAVARAVGLSRFHFQRAFRAHTGLSPAVFRNAVRLGRARDLLRAGQPVLAAALRAGFSGPGRLHDVSVHHEGLTPGELAAGAAGLTLRHAWGDSALGAFLAAATARGLCALRFVAGRDRRRALAALAAEWPGARLVADPALAVAVARRLRPGRPRAGGLRLHLRGTNWQVQVWRALLAIPPGATTTYAALARALGRPQAARAVGGAVAANPVAVLIPCHRVLRANGALGGYRWGPDRKQALLALEAAAATPRARSRARP
jgi:AraC family transcriptional regulator of adaptative response/methylated-DNA-[protein]-cysteine methyltransferase